jgi:hypothetical protein
MFLLIAESCSILSAQDFSSDMKQMHDWYTHQEILGLEMKASIYSSPTTISSTQNGALQKKRGNFFYKLDDSEMLVTDSSLIMISRYNKRIIFRKISPKERHALEQSTYGAAGKIDSLIDKYDSIKYELTYDKLKHYTVYISKKVIMKTELWLEESTGVLRRMVYYYNPSLYKSLYKAEIVLTETSPASPEIFAQERVIQKTGKTYNPAPGFKNYELKIVNDKIIN